MKRASVVIIGVVLFVGLGASRAARVAAAAVQDQQILHYDASALVKLVAVRVLDKDGRPVMGLKKGDFVLTDNGETKTITEFESHTRPEEGMTGAPAEPGVPAAPRILEMNRKIFMFLDLQGNDENGNMNAKTAALSFVATRLRRGDEVGVLGYSPTRGFFIQEYLTADRDKICRAIEGAKELPPSPGRMEDVDVHDTSPSRPGHQAAGNGAMVAGGEALRSANLVDAGEDAFTGLDTLLYVPGTDIFARQDFEAQMTDLARALKYVSGSKSLVLFSGRDLGPAAAALGRTFAEAGTPVYAVNTRNWILRGSFTPVKEHYIWKEHSLKDLSLASGGDYFADIQDVRSITEGVQALTENYYVLGYYIKENWDGKYHRIKVGLRNPEFRVLAQDGYFNPKPFAEMSKAERELQLFDLLYAERPASAEAPDLPVAALETSLSEGPDGILLIEVAVDAKAGVSPARSELFALVRNAALTPVVSLKWEVDLSRYGGKTLVLWTRSPREPGEYQGRIVIRDTASGRSAIGRVQFGIAPHASRDIVLSSPLILVPGRESKVGQLPVPGKRRGAAPEGEFLSLFPLIPRGHTIVVGNLPVGTREIVAVVPVRVQPFPPGNPPRINVGGKLRPHPAGEDTALGLELVDAQRTSDGRQCLVVRIPLPELAPGVYEIEIEAADAASGAADSVRTTLVLK